MIRLVTVGIALVVVLMGIATVGRGEGWSAFAIAIGGAVAGMCALLLMVATRRGSGISAEQAAERLAGTGTYDFSVKWRDQPAAYRALMVERAADLLDELGL